MPAEIRKCPLSEIENAENFPTLLKEYAEESAIDGLPSPAARIEMYRTLEKTGTFHIFGSFVDGVLVGLITVLYSILPHYGISVAVSESFFVMKAHRKSGAGLKLRREAEGFAKGIGSPALLISAPFNGDLAEVLSHSSEYKEISRVFFRKLNDV
jgi:GNAT superfamily N-acetyltransferase